MQNIQNSHHVVILYFIKIYNNNIISENYKLIRYIYLPLYSLLQHNVSGYRHALPSPIFMNFHHLPDSLSEIL